MEKLKLHSTDFTTENIEKLAELFPTCVTEAHDEDGNLKRAVDFDQLRQELSTSVVEGPLERYQLNWPGKSEALLTANSPIAKTLRPCREESVDFDTTKNLFIEGDNLDALKLLQETYLNKVKMIYIDPPYNTGNQFIYDDDFAEDSESYFQRSNQKDDQGQRMVANTESNGRRHSDWLSLMFSRLRLARNLLSEAGVIFISIDDNEVHNLRKICDEIFGEENFIGKFIWQAKKGGGSDNASVVIDHEYVICYSKNISTLTLSRIEIEAEPLDKIDEKGMYRKGRELNKWGANSLREDRPTMYFPIPGPGGEDVYPVRNDGRDGRWRLGKKNMFEIVERGDADFVLQENGKYTVYEKIRTVEPRTSPYRTLINGVGATADGSKAVKELFDDIKAFDFPKPVDLISHLLKIGTTGEESLVLDFFAGSCTTAHAVAELNKNDGGNRKFIMVQLPEVCDDKSEAFKSGYENIAEIGKERIRRAGKKIKDDNADKEGINNLDIGFRVLKVDNSNMKDVYYSPDAVTQDDLFSQADNIREDRTSEDLLFQVLLDWGVDLSLPITQDTIAGKKVFYVDDNALAACFETGVSENFVKELATRQPMRVVFRDSSFENDSVKINVEQIFKLVSPGTEVKSI